jgi:Transposase domain (DUF772)
MPLGNGCAKRCISILAYRSFCRLDLEGKVPDHSTFSKNAMVAFVRAMLPVTHRVVPLEIMRWPNLLVRLSLRWLWSNIFIIKGRGATSQSKCPKSS